MSDDLIKSVKAALARQKESEKEETLEKRSKNVRRELARINSTTNKKKVANEVQREVDYMKQNLAVDQTHSLPSLQDLAEKHHGDRKATDKVTHEQKRAAGWKDNASGEPIRKPEISMEGGNLKVTHMPTPKSVRHETAHALRVDDSLPDLNTKMQEGFGRIQSMAAANVKEAKKKGGDVDAAVSTANVHNHQGEYETRAIESMIARRTGSLPRVKPVPRKEKDAGLKDETDATQHGLGGARKDLPIHKLVPRHTAEESSVVRRDRQKKEKEAAKKKGTPYVKPSQQKPEYIHIDSQPENLRPKIKEKVEQRLDTKEVKVNPVTKKPEQAHNVDAKINARAAGRRSLQDDAKKFKSPKVNDDGQMEFPLAASEDMKLQQGMSYNQLKKTEELEKMNRSGKHFQEQVAAGKRSKWESQYRPKVGAQKGVHNKAPGLSPEKHRGTSEAGAYVKGNKAKARDYDFNPEPRKVQLNEARKEHMKVIAEQKAMKAPDLPKSELALKSEEVEKYKKQKADKVRGDYGALPNKSAPKPVNGKKPLDAALEQLKEKGQIPNLKDGKSDESKDT